MQLIEKYTYCHIPKTGGVALRELLHGHYPLHKVCIKQSGKFLFTFVRHPYSRCLSAFNYLKNGGRNDSDARDSKIYIGELSFEDFVLKKLELAMKQQQHFKPQNYWIPNGADFIGKYENFIYDINKLRKIIAIKNCSVPHKNKTEYNHCDNVPENLKSIIFRLYKKDFIKFDYKK